MTYTSSWVRDDVALLAETARRFFAAEAAPRRAEWEERRGVDRAFWRKAGELGLLCAGVPEEYGGGGGTVAHDLAVLREQAAALEYGFGNPVHSGIVAHYLAEYGTEEQKRRWLPPMASGEVVAAIAMTEPGTGSDLQSIATRAVRDGGEYVITGAKTFITNGGSCDMALVAASTDPARRARGLSLFLVDASAPGFRRGRVLDKIGQHTADTAELFFDEVRVPAGALLGGAEGQGFVQLMRQLPQERLIIGVIAVAAAEQALAHTVRYVKERRAFGEPLFAMQNTRFELAECATLAHAGRVFADSCVERHLRGELDAATASMAKWWLTEVQCQVIDRCLQLFGGYGYMREYPIARMYADARAQKIYGGANEVMKELIARSL
ncbi:acyl-CoA dehydrogenase [Thermocatellispora tengchongensis]|uniref:Acyl-[acyl-carrier-protein] dehydrogenase MbtN n=1 Tax=Thermocatellispora tengchongensis TaxID=1073253 RepID=A0A840P8Z2_9ACTN|nr:acyl-CoA dehydrogenase family protein [Thermocatellispora tengchongensis]MBB5135096.1 acyl-CoA dehydrogenase [Thermocatellispora tengchongensis]